MTPPGRPPLAGERKHEVIQIRLTAAEKEKIDQGAAAVGQKTATWLRDLAITAADEIAAQQGAAKPTLKKATKKKA